MVLGGCQVEEGLQTVRQPLRHEGAAFPGEDAGGAEVAAVVNPTGDESAFRYRM